MKNKQKVKIIELWYSIFLCIYPILCIYKGIGSITIGDLFLLLFTGIAIIKTTRIHSTLPSVIIFLFYAFISLMINFVFSSLLTNYHSYVLLFRVLKLCLYFLSTYICYDKFFNKEIFIKCILLVGFISSVFLLLQYVFYFGFGKIILGRIPGLEIHLEDYSKLDYNYLFSYTFRPFSFFLEPASFCQFMVVPLSICVFENDLNISNMKRFILFILFVFSMIMSTSGQGILYISVIIFIATLIKYKGMKKILLIISIILVTLVLFSYNDQFQFSVNRLLVNQDAQNARLGSYKYILEMDFPKFLFGNGYGTTPFNQYLAGFPYIVYGTGIIGLIMVLNIFRKYFFSSKAMVSKVLCILFFIMFFGTALFYNYMLFWFFGLILLLDNENQKKEKV